MAKTQSSKTEAAMLAFASSIMSQVENTFENMSVSSPQPIESFPPAEGSHYLYVLNSSRGMPLRAGVISGEAGKRDFNRLQKEAQSLARSGMVTSFRYIELGSERMARTIAKWFAELFGGMPLSGLGASGDGAAESGLSEAAPTPAKRRGRPAGSGKKGRRGRPRKAAPVAAEGSEAPRKRGRPPGSKNVQAAESTGAATEAPKRRGRPPGSGKKKAGKRGRPRKASAAVENTASVAQEPKRRGRPPGSKNTTKKGGAKGRPRKASVAVENPAAGQEPKRRGRPPGSRNKK
jgi:hypothetical protein